MGDEPVVEAPSGVLETKRSQACTAVTAISSPESEISKCFQAVVSVVKSDLVAADVKWTLFVAASQSFKHDSCLRPFPPMFVVDGNKDFTALRLAVESVPAFQYLESANLPSPAVMLLHWVLVELREPSLSTVGKNEMDNVLGLVSCELPPPRPALVVRLVHERSSASEQRWLEAEQQYGSLYAFHGSRVDNFHSIVHHGLQQHLTKNALFGQGVYLSSEILVCLPYSRTGLGWKESCFGPACSVLAMCQIINHPSVLCQDEQGTEESRSRARAKDSLAGDVPHKLYVVPNSDLIRVRYLLIYPAQPAPATSQRLTQRSPGVLSWLGRHKMAASLVAYAVLLASIGLSRSPTFLRLWQEVCRWLGTR